MFRLLEVNTKFTLQENLLHLCCDCPSFIFQDKICASFSYQFTCTSLLATNTASVSLLTAFLSPNKLTHATHTKTDASD